MAEFTGTPAASVQYAPFESASLGSVQQALGKPLVLDNFSYTHAAGAGTGEINLLKLPPGKYRIYPALSFLATSQFAANADVHLGHRAYHNADGTAVAADDNEWVDNGDAGGGTLSGPWSGGFETGVGGTTSAAAADYDAADGLTIYMMVDTGDIEDDDTVSGWIAYTKLR